MSINLNIKTLPIYIKGLSKRQKRKLIYICYLAVCLLIVHNNLSAGPASRLATPASAAALPGHSDPLPEEVIPVSPPENLPQPLSGLYPQMAVEPQQFIPLAADDKVVYLTFDDGPWDNTPALLDLLDEYDIKATFFVTAQFCSDEQLAGHLRDIDSRGHTLGVHTFSHVYEEIYTSVESFLADYRRMDEIIFDAIGKRSGLFRLPGGSNSGTNAAIREDLLAEMNSRGLVYHDWNAYNGDCDGLGKAAMISQAVDGATANNKSVLLMHDLPGKDSLLEILPQIIEQLRQQGYRFAPLDLTVKPFQFATPKEV